MSGGAQYSEIEDEHVQGAGVRGLGIGLFVYGEVQCIMGNGHMGPHVDRQTRLKTLPSPLKCNKATLRVTKNFGWRQTEKS